MRLRQRALRLALASMLAAGWGCGDDPPGSERASPPLGSLSPAGRLAELVPQLDTPSGSDAGNEIGRILLAHRRTGWALELARRLTSEHPDAVEPWRLRTATAGASGFPSEALESATRVVELTPSDPRALRQLGILEQRHGAPEAAIAHLRESLALEPTSSSAWYALGRALESTGDDEGALEAFERCLAARSNHPDCQHQRTRLLGRTGRIEQALTALEAVESERQLSATELFLRGSLLLQAGRHEEASGPLERHRELALAEREARESRRRYQGRVEEALMLVVDGEPTAALESIRELRSIGTEDDRLDIMEAEALARLGRTSTALDLAQRAVRARPRFWRYRYLAATYLARLGLADAALRETMLALKLQPLALPALRLERHLLAATGAPAARVDERDHAITALERLARPVEVGQGAEIGGEARELFWVELLLLHPFSRVLGSESLPLG